MQLIYRKSSIKPPSQISPLPLSPPPPRASYKPLLFRRRNLLRPSPTSFLRHLHHSSLKRYTARVQYCYFFTSVEVHLVCNVDWAKDLHVIMRCKTVGIDCVQKLHRILIVYIALHFAKSLSLPLYKALPNKPLFESTLNK